MANEVKLRLTLQTIKGQLNHKFDTGTVSTDQTTGLVYDNVHAIGTTEESIAAFGDIATETYVVLYNLDPTNYVEWGFSTTVYGGKLLPGGGPAVFTGNAGTIYIKANTATCNVRVIAYET